MMFRQLRMMSARCSKSSVKGVEVVLAFLSSRNTFGQPCNAKYKMSLIIVSMTQIDKNLELLVVQWLYWILTNYLELL